MSQFCTLINFWSLYGTRQLKTPCKKIQKWLWRFVHKNNDEKKILNWNIGRKEISTSMEKRVLIYRPNILRRRFVMWFLVNVFIIIIMVCWWIWYSSQFQSSYNSQRICVVIIEWLKMERLQNASHDLIVNILFEISIIFFFCFWNNVWMNLSKIIIFYFSLLLLNSSWSTFHTL